MEMPAEATQCPRRGCHAEKAPDKVLCDTCWSLVPQALKLELHKAWASRKAAMSASMSPEKSRLIADRHERAREAVIASAQRGGG